MDRNAKIYVAGHTGLVGSAIVRKLRAEGYDNLLLKTHGELDLTDRSAADEFFGTERPEYVFVAAGLVGGIKANSEAPADFFSVNMAIAQNVLWSAYKSGVKKLLYLGSACQYPKECAQPMKEELLLTGLPEVTNEGYALAKICGCRLCSYMKRQYGADFISAIPANAYGLNDCFDPQRSHVIPALIMKYRNAKKTGAPSVDLWGTGKALREFLFTDDLADGCLFLMEHYDGDEAINMGSGSEISIMELSETIRQIVGYEGEIVCDPSKPDGMMRRMLDSGRINALGWRAGTDMKTGLKQVYDWYLKTCG
ncbi:MAG: GDP-L-fucose synthase [Oscillospiraceae bacterium]|nr:GDP-L-fucose synthase [Oscillospiraceae bacterium]